MIATFGHSQTIYFKLKDTESHAHISDGQAFFSQESIMLALGDYKAQPVLKYPDKFHSIYAHDLGLTYKIDSEEVSLMEELEGCQAIEYVELEGEPILVSCPTDDPSDADWNINRHTITCVQEAHCITQGDPSIIIAARDNGFIADHPEHEGQVVYAEPGAYNGACHGTQTSITSSGATNNGFGISSSGYNCSLALYRWNDFVADYEDMLLRGVRVAHNSYVSSTCNPNQTLQNIINLVSEQGLIIVASAGNGSGPCAGPDGNGVYFPAAYDDVISVSSVSGGLCCETTYNFWDPANPFDPPLHHTHNNTVDLMCKGYSVVTGNCAGGGQSMAYGTSIAGPHVAGIIGLILSVNPCLNHDDVLSILQSTGQDVTNVCNNSSYYPNGAPPVPCAESAVLAAQNYVGPDLIVDSDTDWDQRFVSGNVIIESGVTLTIHGVVSLNTNSRIIVEKDADLIIDGGILTSCNENWGGIVVEGDGASGSQLLAGRVKLINSAVIENAGTAISMHPNHLGWPAYQNFWGGLLEADDAIFRDCGRVVEFMKYGTGFIEDQSYFNNCTFENIKGDAVSIWANNNVTFKQCTFNNLQTRGIYAYDSEVIVNDNCIFTNQPTGVDILTTYPIPYGSKIGDLDLPANEFKCSQQGVFAQSQGNLRPLEITNNKFFDGSIRGVHINGIANYVISSNDISDGIVAVQSVSTGNTTHTNQIKNNDISNVVVGGYAVENNGNLEYLNNCFNSSLSDVYIFEGEIFIEQGNVDISNGNCFTKGGVPEITNTGNPPIKLWVWENEPITSCKFPTEVFNNPNYNVQVDFSFNQSNEEECGTEFSPEFVNIQTICEGDFNTKQELLNKITEIEQELDNIYNDASLSENYRSRLIKSYERCLQELQKNVIIMILEPTLDDPDRIDNTDERIETAITYARLLPLFEQKILAYGLMVNTNQLNEARAFVNGLITENTANVEKSNFVAAQNINLDYLQDVENYSLSAADAQLLYTIGSGFEPLDGYARSIYEVITGVRILLDIPEPGNNKAETKSANGQIDEPTYTIYPNPSNEDKIFITIDGKADMNNMTINMVDIYGKVYLSEQVKNQRHILNIANLPSGTYITSIVKANGEIQHIEKVMVIK